MVIGLGRFLGQIGRCLGLAGVRDLSDAQLLERFVYQADQAAFAGLVERHGLMVWNVCRRVLDQEQDADDAFQATFFVLMRKARSIRKREALGCWLHGVAYRVACQARAARQRHRTTVREFQAMFSTEAASKSSGADFRPLLDEELSRLPNKYRDPLVLCYLQGRTHEQAARELGWPPGSMSRRLARACELLRTRLVKRGFTLSAATWAVLLAERACAAALPAALVTRTTHAIASIGAATEFSASVTALADWMTRTMFLAKLKLLVGLTLALIGLVAVGVVPQILAQSGTDKDSPSRTNAVPRQTSTKEPADVPVDRHGDPLPPGAVARLGTLRLRHGGQVYSVAYSPDARILASGARDSIIRLWDSATHKELRQLKGHQNTIMSMAFSADGKRLISASEDRTLRLWEVETGKVLAQFQGHEAAVTVVVITPDGKTVISASADRTVRFWEVPEEQPRKIPLVVKETRCLRDDGYLLALALSPDGKTLAAGSSTGHVRLWEVTKGKETKTFMGHERGVNSLAFAGNDHLASCGEDSTVRLWHLPTGKVEWQGQQAHMGYAVTVSRDQQLVAAAGHAGGVLVYDRKTQREWKDRRVQGNQPLQPGDRWAPSSYVPDGIKALAFSPDGRTIAAGGLNSRVHEWDLVTSEERRFPEEHGGAVLALAFSPDGTLLATGSRDRTLRVWNVAKGMERWREENFVGTGTVVGSVAMSPDGRTLASANKPDDLRLWDVLTGREKEQSNSGRCCAFSRDGKLLASGQLHGKIYVCETATGIVRLDGDNKGCEIQHVAFTADGKRLVAACYRSENADRRGALRVWNLTTKKLERDISVHPYGVSSLDCSADGRWIATRGVNEGQVCLWDGALEDPRPTLTPPDLPHAYCATFSPDSKLLAIGTNRVVVLWDLATKKEVRRLEGHLRVIESLAFSADGRLLASGSEDSTVVIWDVSGKSVQER